MGMRWCEQQLFSLLSCVFLCGCLPNTLASHHLRHSELLDLLYQMLSIDELRDSIEKPAVWE